MSIVTEREWRRRVSRASRARPQYWGAQYLIAKERPICTRLWFCMLMLLLSCTFALVLPFAVPPKPSAAQYPVEEAPVQSLLKVRTVSDIGYHLPEGFAGRSVTYTREQLLRGKLMLLDDAHALPPGVPAPNTLSIAAHGKGMVPVRELSVKSGKETIAALQRLFAYARGRGIGGLCVWRGTLSNAEQQELRLKSLCECAERMSLDDAVACVLRETDAPGRGELVQEYTVEIRYGVGSDGVPDEHPLERSDHGRFLLQNAWRFGFVRTNPSAEGAAHYRFRYLGEAHSTAMTYLDLDYESYLSLLHERRMLTVRKDGKLRYIILCAPMNGSHVEFHVPEGARCDAGIDNTGWAVVACSVYDN